jgi:hypothetical protein
MYNASSYPCNCTDWHTNINPAACLRNKHLGDKVMTSTMTLRTIAEDLFEILHDRVITDEELPSTEKELLQLVSELTDTLHKNWRLGMCNHCTQY